MKFIKFDIENFKGIEKAKIILSPTGSNIYTLIGLNESGKTTILEAISTFDLFNDDTAPARVAVGEDRPDPVSFVPKPLKSNFSGKVTIKAWVEFEEGERQKIIKEVESEIPVIIDPDSIPKSFLITRSFEFHNSDYRNLERLVHVQLAVKKKRGRKFAEVKSEDEAWQVFSRRLSRRAPQIVYFPTFLFNTPARIELNPGNDEQPINRLYRDIINNVAKSLQRPLDIQKHIVDRVINKDTVSDKIINIMFLAPDKQEQIQAALSELSGHLSDTVFDSWSRIFGGNFSGREIVLRLGVSGETPDHRVHVDFALKDRKSTYSITERSLGFRWFFSFLLFTIYRVSANKDKSTLFLLDEPASNLHSAAQLQLLESFPKIAKGTNQIIYSTHSHYMVNPDWLDQAFIVSNGAVDYHDVNEDNLSIRSMHTNVNIQRYRDFVGSNPDKVTYFQPVLDKLAVIPSKLDVNGPSIIVEGKGDYTIIEYGRKIILESSTKYSVVPTRGATGMNEIIGLHIGWGTNFIVCLDADSEGKKAAAAYKKDWAAIRDKVYTLADFINELDGKGIEGLLHEEDIQLIETHFSLNARPSKSQIQLYFSEMLASRRVVPMSETFKKYTKILDEKFGSILS